MGNTEFGDVGSGIGALVQLAILVFTIVAMWMVYAKAGKPGWTLLVPIYNAYVLLKISGKPGWWLLLLFIPIVNFVIGFITLVALAANFGKGVWFAIGLLLLPFVFFPILAFGEAEYHSLQINS